MTTNTSYSRIPLYTISSGWIGLILYSAIFQLYAAPDESEQFLKYFLSFDQNGIRFRALVLFAPLITTIIGYMLHQNEKKSAMIAESEFRYRDLFENANDPILLVDNTFKLIDANKKACNAFGYEIEKLVGSNLMRFVPPDNRINPSDLQGTNLFLMPIIRKNRQLLYFEASASSYVRSGQVMFLRIILRDNTRSVRSYKEMSKAYSKLSNIFIEKEKELINTNKLLLLERYERNTIIENLSDKCQACLHLTANKSDSMSN